jgi:hypothetical protein
MTAKTLGPSFAALLLLAGCSADPSPDPGSRDAAAGDNPACEGIPTPMCSADAVPADTTGDGCIDGCRPKSCPLAIFCEEGSEPVDTDGDGCEDVCQPRTCPLEILCEEGTEPADYDGDGCDDACRPIGCPPFAATCSEGQTPADTNGDGCVDACQ